MSNPAGSPLLALICGSLACRFPLLPLFPWFLALVAARGRAGASVVPTRRSSRRCGGVALGGGAAVERVAEVEAADERLLVVVEEEQDVLVAYEEVQGGFRLPRSQFIEHALGDCILADRPSALTRLLRVFQEAFAIE